jgi:hypothetical protein
VEEQEGHTTNQEAFRVPSMGASGGSCKIRATEVRLSTYRLLTAGTQGFAEKAVEAKGGGGWEWRETK